MSYEHLVAGLIGGLTSTLILHPLDLLKVRFAVADGQSSLKKNYKSITNAFSTIVREESFKGLYKGVLPNCMGAGAAWGLYFLFYNQAKEYMLKNNQQHRLGPMEHMGAGVFAGSITTAITNPIWVVKTRLCLQYGSVNTNDNIKDAKNKSRLLPESKQYSGTWDAFKKLYKYEGLAGLYRGFVPGLLNVSHGAIQLAVYEELKRFYIARSNLPNDHNLSSVQYFTCAAASKLLAATLTYPGQVMRARLQDQHVNYNGLIDVARRTWRNEGLLGYFKGLKPSLIRVVPASAITFVVYEHILKTLTG